MEALFFYFAKVVLCSGVMFLYYIIFLKDKTFHHYNRFYLIGTLLVSLLLPLLKVDYFTIDLNQNFYEMMVLFQHQSNSKISTDDLSISAIILGVFALVSLFFLMIFGKGLMKIYQFKSQFPRENFEGISFYMTNLENAPFSFFRNLFWKNSILLQSDLGKQILKHEMVHIEQKHSYDKILIEILTALFWFNPIFYLIRKELNLIHEYLADKKALKNTDAKAFAAMLLEAHFSGQVLPATSPFLNSNLKKRIIMLKKSNTKFSYWRKVFALPLLFMLVFAYMVKAENREIRKINDFNTNLVSHSKSDTINADSLFQEMLGGLDPVQRQAIENLDSKTIQQLKINLKDVREMAIEAKKNGGRIEVSSQLEEKEKFPNPMTINLYRSSDNNTFIISGKEVSKKEFIDYFIKNNTNEKEYYFGSTSTTFKELETAGKLAMFTAGKNKDLEIDQKFLTPIFKKYKNSTKENNRNTDVLQKIFPPKSENIINEKFLAFFNSAEQDRIAKLEKTNSNLKIMNEEIAKKNIENSKRNNFTKDRNYEKRPLTSAEKKILKNDAEELEKIRLKYSQIQSSYNPFQFAFKSPKIKDIIYDTNASIISEETKQNDRILEFPNTQRESEFFIDGKKVSKETLMNYTSNLYKVESFFKEISLIKELKQEKVTDGKNTYLMKLEIFTK